MVSSARLRQEAQERERQEAEDLLKAEALTGKGAGNKKNKNTDPLIFDDGTSKYGKDRFVFRFGSFTRLITKFTGMTWSGLHVNMLAAAKGVGIHDAKRAGLISFEAECRMGKVIRCAVSISLSLADAVASQG
eukprot:SAG31_NODE_2470_length_5649_cov_2.713694_8_plen_133_part_00